MDAELNKRIVLEPGFPVEQETWVRTAQPTQVCLHHTASPPGIVGDINWWKNDKQPVSTPLVIDRDGKAYQIYSTKRWGYSLGLVHADRNKVESRTIGLEIDSWGWLTKKGDQFLSYTGDPVDPSQVCVLDKPHRGMKYFHKYTEAQIETTRLLLLFWAKTYPIDIKYVGYNKMFELCQDAIYARKSGVYSHNSFRLDKTDIHPQPDMIAMLEKL